jgi:hypothetical protein
LQISVLSESLSSTAWEEIGGDGVGTVDFAGNSGFAGEKGPLASA